MLLVVIVLYKHARLRLWLSQQCYLHFVPRVLHFSAIHYINVNVSNDVMVVHTHAKFKWFGSTLVCGRLRVRLLKVSAMGDIVERKFGITAHHFTYTRGVAGGDGELGCLCGKAGVMVPPIHLGAWSMALMLWLPFELLTLGAHAQRGLR